MLIGGCARTCGDLKLSRAMIACENGALRPAAYGASAQREPPVRMDGKRVAPETVKAVHTYFVLYIFIITSAARCLSRSTALTPRRTFSLASLACLSNIGPGLGVNGPYGNYSMFFRPVKASAVLRDAAGQT